MPAHKTMGGILGVRLSDRENCANFSPFARVPANIFRCDLQKNRIFSRKIHKHPKKNTVGRKGSQWSKAKRFFASLATCGTGRSSTVYAHLLTWHFHSFYHCRSCVLRRSPRKRSRRRMLGSFVTSTYIAHNFIILSRAQQKATRERTSPCTQYQFILRHQQQKHAPSSARKLQIWAVARSWEEIKIPHFVGTQAHAQNHHHFRGGMRVHMRKWEMRKKGAVQLNATEFLPPYLRHKKTPQNISPRLLY